MTDNDAAVVGFPSDYPGLSSWSVSAPIGHYGMGKMATASRSAGGETFHTGVRRLAAPSPASSSNLLRNLAGSHHSCSASSLDNGQFRPTGAGYAYRGGWRPFPLGQYGIDNAAAAVRY